MRLKGKTAVVTGGGRGLGAQICRQLAQEGCNVAITDISEETAASVKKDIEAFGGNAKCYIFNIADVQATQAVADQVVEDFGSIDIWVNNAGISRIVPFMECTEELWDSVVEINLKGTFSGCKAALNHMHPKKEGVIINMASQVSKKPNTAFQAYVASKHGVVGLTQSLALEFAPDNIRVNAICPGVIFTPMWENMQKEYAEKTGIEVDEVIDNFKKNIPLGRLCTEKNVADMVVFLASDEASYVTGQSINVSGGSVFH